MCEHCNRREFLEAGMAAGSLMLASTAWTHAWAADSPPKPREKARICVIFTGPPGPEDRGWNADPKQMETMKTRFSCSPVLLHFGTGARCRPCRAWAVALSLLAGVLAAMALVVSLSGMTNERFPCPSSSKPAGSMMNLYSCSAPMASGGQ